MIAVCISSCLDNTVKPQNITEDKQEEIDYSILDKYGSFVDARDGQEYQTIRIHSQNWMAENLNFELPGDSYCYNDDEKNCEVYGRLYSWFAVMNGASSSTTMPSNVQGICPDGWHVPSDAEWDVLLRYIWENQQISGTYNPQRVEVAQFIRDEEYWPDSLVADTTYDFKALGAGYRLIQNARVYYFLNLCTYWWTATEANEIEAYYRYFSNENNYVIKNTPEKEGELSLRCVEDY